MGIGTRLKEERQRLSLTQQALAEACGSSKRQQVRYETEEQVPGGEYFAGAAELGVDVVYVLTGKPASTGTGVSAEEAMLLAAYRNAPAATRALVLAALGAPAATQRAAAGIVIKGGKQGSVVQGDVTTDSITIGVGSRKKK